MGDPSEDALLDRIDLWHQGGFPPTWSLQQALGMTDVQWKDYIWGFAPKSHKLPEIPKL